MVNNRDIALEALSTILNTHVTSHQKHSRDGHVPGAGDHLSLYVNNLLKKMFHAHEKRVDIENKITEIHIIDEDEFFDPKFDYDFTKLKDTEKFYRGGEVYERPCGWHRYALKVLDKYDDGNAWLGTRNRRTRSDPGEWPVSFHGTSKEGAEAIIEDHYKPGPHQAYGRGIYSTPHMFIAEQYAFPKRFTSKKTSKTYEVILQNRINLVHIEKHFNDKYWLVPIPDGASDEDVHEIVERSIRPYGLLVKEV